MSTLRAQQFSSADIEVIASLSISRLSALPPDPSNRVADDPAAADLGRSLFNDVRLSSRGDISCSSCHQETLGFDDHALPGKGVGSTTRRTMPLVGAAYSPWLFWDGRADSLWAQALGPLEADGEHAISRVAVAHLVDRFYRADYVRLFGPLPPLASLPAGAGPFGTPVEITAWQALDAKTKAEINQVFANVGKALAAFERTLVPSRSRFDDFADALVAGTASTSLSPLEQRGLALFVGKGQCTQCHSGPLFTDHFFHNTGVPEAEGLPLDLGRMPAVATVQNSPFNCLGPYSDARPTDCAELRFIADNDSLLRAFKTPSLRNIGQRAPYMHAGQFADLDSVVEHYNDAPWAKIGVSELHRPGMTTEEKDALLAFLGSL